MRLIDADALIEDLQYDVELDARALDGSDIVGDREAIQFDKDCKQNCVDLLRNAPTVDPVKHGRWIDKYGDGDWHCSCCGAIVENHEQDYRNWYFCYHCGARMDGDKNG